VKRLYEPWPNGSRSPNGADQQLIATANTIAVDYARQGYNLTLRQLYYQFVAHHGLPNSDRSYKRLGDVINKARLAGFIDWNYLVDRTRTPSLPYVSGTPEELVRTTANAYALDKRADQDVHVEVWVEKEALAEVAQRAGNQFDVPTFSCRGYTSASAMYLAGRRLFQAISRGQAVRILHLGDHDPSGIDMTRDITDRLERFLVIDWLYERSPSQTHDYQELWGECQATLRDPSLVPFQVDRIALNMDQIDEYDPPPNPAKVTDSRAAGYIERFGEESWELDALAPDVLVALISEHVAEHTDQTRVDALQEEEDRDREALTVLGDRWDDVRAFLGV
jgi:hypothetical protein